MSPCQTVSSCHFLELSWEAKIRDRPKDKNSHLENRLLGDASKLRLNSLNAEYEMISNPPCSFDIGRMHDHALPRSSIHNIFERKLIFRRAVIAVGVVNNFKF